MKNLVHVSVISLLLCSSCSIFVTPYPASKRIESRVPTNQTYDLSFIHPGVTKKEEVENKLADLKLDTHTPGLFWGRFAVSRFGTAFGIEGAAGGAVSAKRHWSGRNLLVTFNDAGTVATSRVISDSDLNRTFIEWFKDHPRRLVLPLVLYVPQSEHDKVNREGHLILDEHEIRYEASSWSCDDSDQNKTRIVDRSNDLRSTCSPNLVFPLTNPVRLQSRSLPVKTDAGTFARSLALSCESKKVSFNLDTLSCDELLDLLAYLHKYCPRAEYR